MDPVQGIARGATAALRLGRGLADRAVQVTGPRLARVVRRAAEGAPLRRRAMRETSPATFTPSPRQAEKADQAGQTGETAQTSTPPAPAAVTPGSVARNIAKQRPVARAASGRSASKSVPGAKLPTRRPGATA